MDNSLQPPPIVLAPGPKYLARAWQGIPGIERAANGRLWATWYSGGEGEGPDNYVLLVTSDDDGAIWSPPVLAVDPPGQVRAFDPCLWHDPLGRLWLFWAQSEGFFDGRLGVWAICTEESGQPAPRWSAPRRLGNGIMMNKPTVLQSGEWLLPAAIWPCQPHHPDMASERSANVLVSTDHGRTWTFRGGADLADRAIDEHMLVERRDGMLWMLVRTRYGIGQTFSSDGGKTWSPGEDSKLGGPNSRFFIRRLQSGRLLLINHVGFTRAAPYASGRTHLTALLSDDDGATWPWRLLLDERGQVSYPDGVQAEDGTIYIIYDRNRGDANSPGKEREILRAVFTEEDVQAGRCVSAAARLKQIVDQRG